MSKCCSTCRWLGPLKTTSFDVEMSEYEMKEFCEDQASGMLPSGANPFMVGKPPVAFGECRFGPPSSSVVDGLVQTMFPVVGSGDWCSKHEPSIGSPSS